MSTVWLGINHNWGSGPPVIFETMVFAAEGEGVRSELDLVRYATEAEALAGHKQAIARWGANRP